MSESRDLLLGEFLCQIKTLPEDQWLASAEQAVRINPLNAPPPHMVHAATRMMATAFIPEAIERGLETGELLAEPVLPPGFLAALTGKYWGSDGADLTVGFLEPNLATSAIRNKTLDYANVWSRHCNARFRYTANAAEADIRITFLKEGYYSYLGTDNKLIARNLETMCLQGFHKNPPESEWMRVVPHECAHALGFPHEHMRKSIIELLDVNKTLAWGARELGWNATTVRQQILTPLDERSIMGSTEADPESIMCYRFPGSITKNGQPILGGSKLSPVDIAFCSKIYPLVNIPPPVQSGKLKFTMAADGRSARVEIAA